MNILSKLVTRGKSKSSNQEAELLEKGESEYQDEPTPAEDLCSACNNLFSGASIRNYDKHPHDSVAGLRRSKEKLCGFWRLLWGTLVAKYPDEISLFDDASGEDGCG